MGDSSAASLVPSEPASAPRDPPNLVQLCDSSQLLRHMPVSYHGGPGRCGYPPHVRFEITHAFDASADAVAEALLDEEFQESLSDIGALAERSVLAQEEQSDSTVVRRTRCVLDVKATGTAKKFLGDQRPAWIEEAVWDPEEMRWEWTIHPEVAAELLKAKGTIDIADDGDGSERTVSGEVKVTVPLYGSKVENWIVAGLEAAYQEEADRLAEWLDL